MNLEYITKTDKQLDRVKLEATSEGRLARKEIQRRKAVGYWDGTMTIHVDALAEMEVETTTSTEREYAPGVLKL